MSDPTPNANLISSNHELPSPARPDLLLELVREMRGQRESFEVAQQDAAAERRSSREK